MTAAVRQPGAVRQSTVADGAVGAGLSDLLEPPRERAVLFRGWCYLCGFPIYPSRTNWYCRVCAQVVRGGR